MRYIATVHDREFLIEIEEDNQVTIDGQTYTIDFAAVSGQPVYSLILDGKSYEAFVYYDDGEWKVLLRGGLYPVFVEDEREKRLRAASGAGVQQKGEFHLKAPMPGLIVSIPVKEGEHVSKGTVLVILESMKMQNELKAPRDGVVSRLRVKQGDTVEQKQTLVSLV